MNTLDMYAVFDTKSKLFGMPHFQKSDGVAIRSFSTACESPETELNKYPSDFSLYHIGTFHVESGELVPATPRQICNASEFVQPTYKNAEYIADKAKEMQNTLDTAIAEQ